MVDSALKLLEKEEQNYQQWLEQTRRKVTVGLKQLEIGEKCNNLMKFTDMGRCYDQIIPNLLGISLNNYIILYQVTEEEIEIVRVVSGYRDLESLFSDEENR